jgi:hypothetical protein
MFSRPSLSSSSIAACFMEGTVGRTPSSDWIGARSFGFIAILAAVLFLTSRCFFFAVPSPGQTSAVWNSVVIGSAWNSSFPSILAILQSFKRPLLATPAANRILPSPEHSIPFFAHLRHDGSFLSQTILRREHWKQPCSLFMAADAGIFAPLSGKVVWQVADRKGRKKLRVPRRLATTWAHSHCSISLSSARQ